MAATPWIGSEHSAFDLRHICVITETYPPEVNGVAFTLAHLVDGLSARGHAVSVVRPYQQASDPPDCRCGPDVTLVPSLPFPWYWELQVDVIVTSHKIRMVRPSRVAILQRTRPPRP
jgi:hypothetical protein